MTQVLLTLGSNIRPEANLADAVRRLAERFAVRAVSGVYETEAIGRPEQPRYLNAAVVIECDMDPDGLKAHLLEIEAGMGRVRGADRYAPRVIDIDITLFGREVLRLGERAIPDPELLAYAHIAGPAAELWPDYRHPEYGHTLADIARALPSRDIRLRPDVTLGFHHSP